MAVKKEQGFTLPEVLISLGLGTIVLSAVIALFHMQSNAYHRHMQITEMVQTVRAALDMMCREVRMAGYNPTGAVFEGLPCETGTLRICADLRGKKKTDPPDGDTDDPHENITYRFDPKKCQITRSTGGGNQPFAENITDFSFAFLNSKGEITTKNGEVCQVFISMTARTARPDPAYKRNGGYRVYTMTALVTPANLDCER